MERLFAVAMIKREDRPDHKDWKPVANSCGEDRTEAYRRAANRLQIHIVISYPIPGDSAEAVAGMQGVGIYIKRDQSNREDELTSEMFNEFAAMKT